jgi:RHS repeat-associated core domain
MVYDNADRLVASQDGNQLAKGQWTVNRYDQFDRLLYSFIAGNNQSDITAAFGGTPANETWNGNATTGGYSLTGSANLTAMLTVNYYDNYSFISNATLNYDNSQEQNGYTSRYTNAKGMLTGTRIYHLDDPSKYETSATYYDKYGRAAQTRATNHLGGYDITYNALDFTGKPLKTLKTHGINGNVATYTELYQYTYDHAQRLLTTTHQLNGGNTVTLVSNSYDPLGRLQTKTLGGVDATSYSYNIRSWVTGILGNRFTENLYYNQNTANLANFTASYNGNIAGMLWSVPAEGLGYNRAYSFAYDGLNRLTAGNYTGGTAGAYNETFGYDKMGNISNLVRYGVQSTSGRTFGKIDDLVLEHTGNQLTRVTDYGNDGLYYGNEEFLKNTANSGNSAAYDANGNRLYDSNSNVWAIKYNTLNLPEAMQFYQGHQTSYTYSAAGTKLKVVDKTAPEGVTLPISSLNTILSNPSVSSTTTTDYAGNYIYENGSLKRILLPEGYWQNGAYFYYLKDHLGSNRVVIRNDGTVVETSNYYPSGMRFGESVASGGSVQPYRHTGHEMQAMHGLNWIDNNARFRTVSDGAGFTGVDPLAEVYYSISPYAYCNNNPINKIDPDGRGVNDNNLLPEVTCTASAPTAGYNYAYSWFPSIFDRSKNDTQIKPNKPSQPVPNSNTPHMATLNLPNANLTNPAPESLETVMKTIGATGVVADNVNVFVAHYGGKEIVYVTTKGTNAAIEAVKITNALSKIAHKTIIVGVVLDATSSAMGYQSWTKTGINAGIAVVSAVIGAKISAGLGVAIGTLYFITDPLHHEYHSSSGIREVTPNDATKIYVPKFYK